MRVKTFGVGVGLTLLIAAVTGVSQSAKGMVAIPVGVHDARTVMCHRSASSPAQIITGGPWKQVASSTFYIGEGADASNAYISNASTAWSDHAVADFGSGPDRWGPKDPSKWDGAWWPRDGYCPKGVAIKQNPFYVALPVLDHDQNGRLAAAEQWVRAASAYLPELKRFQGGHFGDAESPWKNLWVQIEYKGKTAFAQLEDAGPSNVNDQTVADFEYVAGTSPQPKNSFGLRAGIDLSPAVTDYLGTRGSGTVRWRFVPAAQVPAGPWKVLPTTAGPNWN